MQIKYCPIDGGNFGDALNTTVWQQLFPDLTQIQNDMLVYGIGTLLDGRHDRTLKKAVLGSGIGQEHAARPDPNWDFRWVRGPLSAREFGLPESLALGDPAVLFRDLQAAREVPKGGPIGLIPHYRTWDSFDWVDVARKAGMVAINPRQSPKEVVAQLRSCSKVLAESLHGGICADAMAIPWAPCVLAHRFNDFKWKDWMATVNRKFDPMVSDRPLLRTISRSKATVNRLARWVRYKNQTRRPNLRGVANATASDVACVSESLARFACNDAHFVHSDPRHVNRQRERMLMACEQFARDYGLCFTP